MQKTHYFIQFGFICDVIMTSTTYNYVIKMRNILLQYLVIVKLHIMYKYYVEYYGNTFLPLGALEAILYPHLEVFLKFKFWAPLLNSISGP